MTRNQKFGTPSFTLPESAARASRRLVCGPAFPRREPKEDVCLARARSGNWEDDSDMQHAGVLARTGFTNNDVQVRTDPVKYVPIPPT